MRTAARLDESRVAGVASGGWTPTSSGRCSARSGPPPPPDGTATRRGSTSRGGPVTEMLLRRTAPAPGERVLEVACGPGGVGLEAAALVGPQGTVVLTDVAEEMTAIAARRAEALGLRQVQARPADAEALAEPDASVRRRRSRRMGLMLVPDPDARRGRARPASCARAAAPRSRSGGRRACQPVARPCCWTRSAPSSPASRSRPRGSPGPLEPGRPGGPWRGCSAAAGFRRRRDRTRCSLPLPGGVDRGMVGGRPLAGRAPGAAPARAAAPHGGGDPRPRGRGDVAAHATADGAVVADGLALVASGTRAG